jgi:predicted enzyme related to lactoylglutathione lyase
VRARLTKVLIRVPDIERAVKFYDHAMGTAGRRVSPGRCHYALGGVELACYDPAADGDLHDTEQGKSYWQLYLAVDDLESALERVGEAGGHIDQTISIKPWGERSFYATDPFGNRICILDEATVPPSYSRE